MAGSDGRLTKEEKDKIKTWLENKTKNPACPVCNDPNWVIGDHLVQPMNGASGGLVIGGVTYPQVMIISTNCGYTRYFNAVVMGIARPGSPPPTPLKELERR